MLVVLLLGVVTDYAVFFLHGMKQRLEAGERRLDAAHAQYLRVSADRRYRRPSRRGRHGRARGRRGAEFFRAFGPGMALTVLVSLAISVTLIPALMAILGFELYWPRTLAVDERPSRPSRVAYLVGHRPARSGGDRARRRRRPRRRVPGLLDGSRIAQIQGLAERAAAAGPRAAAQRLRARDPLPHGAARGASTRSGSCPRSSASNAGSAGARHRCGDRAGERRRPRIPDFVIVSDPPAADPARARPRATGRAGDRHRRAAASGCRA